MEKLALKNVNPNYEPCLLYTSIVQIFIGPLLLATELENNGQTDTQPGVAASNDVGL